MRKLLVIMIIALMLGSTMVAAGFFELFSSGKTNKITARAITQPDGCDQLSRLSQEQWPTKKSVTKVWDGETNSIEEVVVSYLNPNILEVKRIVNGPGNVTETVKKSYEITGQNQIITIPCLLTIKVEKKDSNFMIVDIEYDKAYKNPNIDYEALLRLKNEEVLSVEKNEGQGMIKELGVLLTKIQYEKQGDNPSRWKLTLNTRKKLEDESVNGFGTNLVIASDKPKSGEIEINNAQIGFAHTRGFNKLTDFSNTDGSIFLQPYPESKIALFKGQNYKIVLTDFKIKRVGVNYDVRAFNRGEYETKFVDGNTKAFELFNRMYKITKVKNTKQGKGELRRYTLKITPNAYKQNYM